VCKMTNRTRVLKAYEHSIPSLPPVMRASQVHQAVMRRRERLRRWFLPIPRSMISKNRLDTSPLAGEKLMSTLYLSPTRHLMRVISAGTNSTASIRNLEGGG